MRNEERAAKRLSEAEGTAAEAVLELPEGEVSAPDDGYAVGPHAGPHVEGEHDNKGEYSQRRGMMHPIPPCRFCSLRRIGQCGLWVVFHDRLSLT